MDEILGIRAKKEINSLPKTPNIIVSKYKESNEDLTNNISNMCVSRKSFLVSYCYHEKLWKNKSNGCALPVEIIQSSSCECLLTYFLLAHEYVFVKLDIANTVSSVAQNTDKINLFD